MTRMMRTSDFDFVLPPELIAQRPVAERDRSRLLVLNRGNGQVAHRTFRDLLEYFRPGDVLLLNNSRVIPARLRAANARTAGRFEVVLLEENAVNDWWVMLRPGKRARVGTEMAFLNHTGSATYVTALVIETNSEGHRRVKFSGVPDVTALLDFIGEVPLPPYIERESPAALTDDKLRYQTVYAVPPGSVAAPTAGLHFTEVLLSEIRALGVEVCFLTLHVGAGTFAPVKSDDLANHVMHEERYEVGDEAVRAINEAKQAGRRVFAVGSTTTRVLESVAAEHNGKLVAGNSRTRIFIYPPYRFRIVDALLTNFHLPRSTLLMLVSAFAASGEIRGRELVLSAYEEAVRERYRFFSYGDAMLLI
jgi:S-adenosylmethionine:tRNA ribosyltransferase-isomerase